MANLCVLHLKDVGHIRKNHFMQLTAGELYHVYNRGNNKEIIFPQVKNYTYFIGKLNKYIKPCCDILSWCLMPNHFHLLIHANQNSIPVITDGSFERQKFSEGIKHLLSSYARAINKQDSRTGSLFQQKTKARWISKDDKEYAITAFHYIHQNPLKANLVKRMEAWRYSSFNEYLMHHKDGLCNLLLAEELLDIDIKNFYQDSYQVQLIQKI